MLRLDLMDLAGSNHLSQVSEGEKTDSAISWSSVSDAIPDRNNKDCRKRWYKLIGAKKGLWAVSEDERLLEGVRKYGSQWTQVAKTVETRSSDRMYYKLGTRRKLDVRILTDATTRVRETVAAMFRPVAGPQCVDR